MRATAFRYVKMIVIPNPSSSTMNDTLSTYAKPEAVIKSDGWRGFSKIREVGAKNT